jgi:hypothetical protein
MAAPTLRAPPPRVIPLAHGAEIAQSLYMFNLDQRVLHRSVRPLAAMFAIAMALTIFVGCNKEPEVVQPKRSTEDIRREHEAEKRGESRTRRTTATPRPVATPKSDLAPVLISAVNMKVRYTEAVSETTNSKGLLANGQLYAENVNVPFDTAYVTIIGRGDPAGNVWPEYELHFVNTADGRNLYTINQRYIDTKDFAPQRVKLDRLVPAGNYQIIFGYLNNPVPTDVKEDRNVFLRTIMLEPAEE